MEDEAPTKPPPTKRGSKPREHKYPRKLHDPEDWGTIKRDPGKRGKPRRAAGLSEVSTVRIDARAAELLKREFGSLGNALYFVAKGISLFRERHGLSLTQPQEDEGSALDALTFADLASLRDLLWHQVDRWRGVDKGIAPSVRLLRKVEALLYGGNAYPGGLPPLAEPLDAALVSSTEAASAAGTVRRRNRPNKARKLAERLEASQTVNSLAAGIIADAQPRPRPPKDLPTEGSMSDGRKFTDQKEET